MVERRINPFLNVNLSYDRWLSAFPMLCQLHSVSSTFPSKSLCDNEDPFVWKEWRENIQ